MQHNHLTRDNKAYGECPACDEYHDKRLAEMELQLSEEIAVEPVCTGLLFRSRVSTYFDGKKMGERKSLNILKRKSCRCPLCEFILSEMKEYDFSCTYSWLNDIEDNQLYTVEPTIEHVGDGYDADCGLTDFKFIKVKE